MSERRQGRCRSMRQQAQPVPEAAAAITERPGGFSLPVLPDAVDLLAAPWVSVRPPPLCEQRASEGTVINSAHTGARHSSGQRKDLSIPALLPGFRRLNASPPRWVELSRVLWASIKRASGVTYPSDPSPDSFMNPASTDQIPSRPGPNRGRRFSDQSRPRYARKPSRWRVFCNRSVG